mmetsp:Transcript_38240/g.94708  ORF Transcript_38240/g.94708 Transcript_38240/m.94708 type:complete len:84 (-) Transcript_38240:1487-1738(-)
MAAALAAGDGGPGRSPLPMLARAEVGGGLGAGPALRARGCCCAAAAAAICVGVSGGPRAVSYSPALGGVPGVAARTRAAPTTA